MVESRLQVRIATINDADFLSEFAAKTFYVAFARFNEPANIESYIKNAFNKARLSEELSSPNSIFLIGEICGEVAGYAKLRIADSPDCVAGPEPIEIERFYVSPSLIGHGIGGDLMQICLSEAQNRGFQTIWLGVWEQNEKAIKFYRRWGFREVGDHIFQLGSDPQRDLIMERSLK